MIAARNTPLPWMYQHKAGAIHGFPQRPVCSFCGERAVFLANVQVKPYKKAEWYACYVCKETLREVSVKSFLPPPTWATGVEELWYTMPRERVLMHPLYLKWQGC